MLFSLEKWKTAQYIAKTAIGERVVRVDEHDSNGSNRFCDVTLTADELFTRTLIYQWVGDELIPVCDHDNLKLTMELK